MELVEYRQSGTRCQGLSVCVCQSGGEGVGIGAASLCIRTSVVPSLRLGLLFLQGGVSFLPLLLLCFLLLVIAIDTDFSCQS